MKRKPVWQISIVTTTEAEDAVAALLEEITGVVPTSFTDAETGATTVSACSPQSFDRIPRWRKALNTGLARIRDCGIDIGPGQFAQRRLKAEDWAESWKRHFKPFAIGRRLLVKPSWSRRQPRGGQATVILDPGLSFGTGQHPTTRFCLEQLANFRKPGSSQSLLDVGTGSGILAIAAAKLGYAPVAAFDFDPDCVRVAGDNAKSNGVTKKLQLARADITKARQRSSRKYSVVCANLLANLLIAEREKLVARTLKNGVLIVAGILQREFHEVQADYEKAGLKLIASRIEKEWQSGAFVVAR